ncbi:hypothetical protein C8R44DRAFT_745048 [Mycena epipterygia]|nr:hypothetical protein C8R44DRAFT_745048 [Mycena epipterygia]
MPAKVVILAQFDHGYYIRETLKRLTDAVAWLKAWWICIFGILHHFSLKVSSTTVALLHPNCSLKTLCITLRAQPDAPGIQLSYNSLKKPPSVWYSVVLQHNLSIQRGF